MSKRLNELRLEYGTIVKQMRALHDKAEKEKRAFSNDETAQYDGLRSKLESMQASIEREEQISAEELRTARVIDPATGSTFGPPNVVRNVETGRELRVGHKGCNWRDIWKSTDTDDAEMRAAAESGEFGIDDFVRGIANIKPNELTKRALSVGTDTAGGFTVPTVLMPGIFDALVPQSSLLTAGVRVVRDVEGVQGGAKSFNYAAVNAIPTAAWRNESGAVSESDPTFRNIAVTPRSLAFYFKVSRELLGDAPNLRQALNTAIGASFARELDRVGLRGTGTAPQPRGLLNVSGVQAVTNGANGASLATLRFGNLLSAYQAIRQADAPAPTAAIMSPRSLVGFASLADSTNQPLRRPPLLDSMQMIDTSQIPNTLTVGTSVDCSEIYVGDFSWAMFFFRENVSIQLATELFALTGEVGFICHVRADFVPIYPAAFSVITGVRP